MYNNIYTMRQDLEMVRKPVGTRDNPARTCKDLYYGHALFPDGMSTLSHLSKWGYKFSLLGWYWIDPNLGMIDDAVYVYCNMSSKGETCVYPDIHSSTMPNIPWRKDSNKNDWYSNLRGGFRVIK